VKRTYDMHQSWDFELARRSAALSGILTQN
jgi:hypothetical protein